MTELYSNPHKDSKSYRWSSKKYLRIMFYRWLLKRYCKGNSTVLDVACGAGQFMVTADKLGFKAYGVDADIKHEKENVFISDLKDFEGKYDVVFNSMILEHMRDQQQFVRKMTSLSNNIVITISAYLSVKFYDTPDHTKPTTKTGVRFMFRRCGFRTLLSTHIPFYKAVVVVSKRVVESDDDLESIRIREGFWN